MPAAHLRTAALLLLLLSPALAAAQKPLPSGDRQDMARVRALEGLKLFGADRWTEALTTFNEADSLYHAPSVTLYVARCQRKLGKLLAARATYDRILAEDVARDASPQFIQAHVEAGKELEALKANMPTLRVVVTGVPAGEAQVTLNGAPLGNETRELDPGTYTVEVRTRTPPPITRAIPLIEGSHETVTIDAGPGGGEGGGRGRGWVIPGIAALGVGVIGLGVGAVTGGLSLSKVNAIKSRCESNNHCPKSLASEGDTAKLLGNVSTAGFVVGGVGVAGAALVYFLWPVLRPAETQTGWRANVGIGRVDVEGRF